MSIVVLCIFAIISAASRGVISVIDRYQMGYRKESALTVNFYNNLLAAIVATIVLLTISKQADFRFLTTLSGWMNIFLYALLVQGVAYGYSFVYKKLTVLDAVIVSKSSDVLIPVALFVTTGYFSWYQYSFSILSTLLVFTLGYVSLNLAKQRNQLQAQLSNMTKASLIIVPIIVFQACVSPLLVTGVSHSIYTLMAFTLFTIYIRLGISFVSLVPKYLKASAHKTPAPISKKQVILIYGSRAFLTVLAQVTFTLATSSSESGIAWIFLNMTSLYSVVFSHLILKEDLYKSEFIILVVVTLLAIIGSL